jgi:hypothetical protein
VVDWGQTAATMSKARAKKDNAILRMRGERTRSLLPACPDAALIEAQRLQHQAGPGSKLVPNRSVFNSRDRVSIVTTRSRIGWRLACGERA